jgi:hypothetical protein
MNCFTHDRTAAIGMCVVCQRGICRDCVGRDSPRLVCRTCVQQRVVLGFDYRSAATLAGLPLIHICAGIDPATMRPRAAKGVIAIGNIAVGVVAIAGLACGLVTVGGASLGLLFALGGAAVGFGLSIGGVAIGSIAIGGAAIGFAYAVGGLAFGQAIVDGSRCDPAALEFFRSWLGSSILPPRCR